MILLIDRDILGSFCAALEVEWEIVDPGASLFFTRSGPDFVYCTWDPTSGGAVRVELGVQTVLHYQELIEEQLKHRRQRLDGVRATERRELIDEVVALIAMRRMLK